MFPIIKRLPIFTLGFIKPATRINVLQTIRLNCTAPMNNAKPKGLKALMQVYGYSALAVYLTISFIDLPLSFLMVHSVGEEKIQVYLNKAKQLVGYGKAETDLIEDVRKRIEQREQDKLNDTTSSMWETLRQSTLITELIIAYGIHKSLIVFRIPMTAAITPAAFRLMSRYGINFGKKSSDIFRTASQDATLRYKGANEIVKNGSIAKQKKTKGQKWFNGLM